jgi:hypothetical protein
LDDDDKPFTPKNIKQILGDDENEITVKGDRGHNDYNGHDGNLDALKLLNNKSVFKFE